MDENTRLANLAWESLLRAQATLSREFVQNGDWGELLPREYGVLYALSKAADGVRITDLGADALLTQAGISRLVGRLEKRGLVERRDDPHDARACRIGLTAEGIEVQRLVGRAHARQVATAMSRALGPAELERLRDLTCALIAASPPGPTSPQRMSERSLA